jgi:hypothetical protein
MKDKDLLEDKTYADFVEDENNERITGIVPEVVEIVAEPKGVDIEESASKQKKVFCPRKIKSLPVYHDDELRVLLLNWKMLPSILLHLVFHQNNYLLVAR